MHYYQHNIGDYRRDTTHLSLLEHGIYRQLLDWHYLDQAPIPEETQQVFRRLSARTDEEKAAVVLVLNEYFTRTKDGYVQGRVMREVAEYEQKAERSRANGKKGGRPLTRMNTEEITQQVISGLPDETQTKANQGTNKPINQLTQEPIKQEPKTKKKKPSDEQTFAEWSEKTLAAGEDLVPAGDSVFLYASQVGIPDEVFYLHWEWFKEKYSCDPKTKKVLWRKHLLNSLKGNWSKLFYFDNAGDCQLTTAGKMAKRNFEALV